jgi:hypothetical protein
MTAAKWALDGSAWSRLTLDGRLAPVACRFQHFAHQDELGFVDVGGFDDHRQSADRLAEAGGDVALQLGELDQVALALLAEIDAVGIDDQFETTPSAARNRAG